MSEKAVAVNKNSFLQTLCDLQMRSEAVTFCDRYSSQVGHLTCICQGSHELEHLKQYSWLTLAFSITIKLQAGNYFMCIYCELQ